MVQEYMFESFDGTELYGKTDSVADPRGVVVIVHGLCEHQGRYDYLTMRLNAQGYSVYRFDHRGHGRSKGTKVFYSAFDEIAKDIDVVVDRAIAENPESPLFIVGHSMGGYGTLKCVLQTPERYAGAATFSAVADIEEFAAGQTAAEKRELQAVFGQSLKIPADCNLLTLAEKADASGLPKLYMACGEQDGLYAANVRLSDKLTALGADIRFEHWEGIHNWVFWDAAVRKALDYLL